MTRTKVLLSISIILSLIGCTKSCGAKDPIPKKTEEIKGIPYDPVDNPSTQIYNEYQKIIKPKVEAEGKLPEDEDEKEGKKKEEAKKEGN